MPSENERSHAIRRAAERYGVDLKAGDLRGILYEIVNGRATLNDDGYADGSLRATCVYKGRRYSVVLAIVTMLPPGAGKAPAKARTHSRPLPSPARREHAKLKRALQETDHENE